MLFQTSRRLLIGASSPVGYFYARAAEKGRPAPILESPLSYCLLYDEVWFLSRALCPYNMEQLDYVHFVDEELRPEGLPRDAIPAAERGPMGPFPAGPWNNVIEATIGRRWSYDNHSRALQFGELRLLPTPGRRENLLVDRYVAAEYGMDLVENTANALWSREIDEKALQMTISERLLKARVTSLQTLDGPWHPAIADLRRDSLLHSYRQRIWKGVEIEDLAQVDERVQELSNEFERVTAKIVEEHFDMASLSQSALLFLVGLMPGAGIAAGAVGLLKDAYAKWQARERQGWVGFLGRAQRSIKRELGANNGHG